MIEQGIRGSPKESSGRLYTFRSLITESAFDGVGGHQFQPGRRGIDPEELTQKDSVGISRREGLGYRKAESICNSPLRNVWVPVRMKASPCLENVVKEGWKPAYGAYVHGVKKVKKTTTVVFQEVPENRSPKHVVLKECGIHWASKAVTSAVGDRKPRPPSQRWRQPIVWEETSDVCVFQTIDQPSLVNQPRSALDGEERQHLYQRWLNILEVMTLEGELASENSL